MKQTAILMKVILTTVLAIGTVGFAVQARAADLPLASASPLTGVAFDDRPLLLPVEINFQMAMLAASSELGRSCGKMEAYGWRMSQAEQSRVNQIFRSTVDKLSSMGYTVASETLKSMSKDITLFTADGSNKHFMFLWSAGESGLVLNLCETGAPMALTHRPTSIPPSVQVFPLPMEELAFARTKTTTGRAGAKAPTGAFSPVGEWVGGYTCAQGYTGGALKIGPLKGRDFKGVFEFYPTDKNFSIPEGSYAVYGQYDKESKRILINPGKWIKKPKSFYNTVMVGSFDPVRDAFSAYFEGIRGCTSFEARRANASNAHFYAKKYVPAKHVIKKKKVAKKTHLPIATKSAPVFEAPAQSVSPPMDDKKDVGGIDLTPPPAAPPSDAVPIAVSPLTTVPPTAAPPNAATDSGKVPGAGK